MSTEKGKEQADSAAGGGVSVGKRSAPLHRAAWGSAMNRGVLFALCAVGITAAALGFASSLGGADIGCCVSNHRVEYLEVCLVCEGRCARFD